jgi:hypothetical protein
MALCQGFVVNRANDTPAEIVPEMEVSPKLLASEEMRFKEIQEGLRKDLDVLQRLVTTSIEEQRSLKNEVVRQFEIQSGILQETRTAMANVRPGHHILIGAQNQAPTDVTDPLKQTNAINDQSMRNPANSYGGGRRVLQYEEPQKVDNEMEMKARDKWRKRLANEENHLLKAEPHEIKNSFRLRVRHMVLSSRWDIAQGVMILFNIIVTCVSLEWRGEYEAYLIGIRKDDAGWKDAKPYFEASEKTFATIYLAEMVLRIWALRWLYLRDRFNWMDSIIVVFSAIDALILDSMRSSKLDLSILRVFRMARIARLLRLMRASERLADLRIIIHTLGQSISSIKWSVLVLAGIVIGCGILWVQLTLPLLEDDTIKQADREWIFDTFGTPMRSFYTCYECLFSTKWTTLSDKMIYEMNALYAIPWIMFVVLVNFIVIRVISAIFLKQTLAMAALDSEKVAAEKMKKKEFFAAKLTVVFKEMDNSGDGTIARREFIDTISKQHVIDLFTELDLGFDEVLALFNVLTDDDSCNYEELLNGALKLKTGSRVVDNLQVLHEAMQGAKAIKALSDNFLQLRGDLSRVLSVPLHHPGDVAPPAPEDGGDVLHKGVAAATI